MAMMIQKAEESAANEKTEENKETDIIYKLEDVPPWYLSVVLGLQHYLTMFSGAIAIPFLLTPSLCIPDDSPYKGHIISTTLFASGIASFLQTTFGCRLPIIQGPSIAFLVPALAILNLPQWQCPSQQTLRNMTKEEQGEVWMMRMREVQGAIIVGAIIEVFVGLTGLIGFLMKWITPLSIAPTIALIGLALFRQAAIQASGNWWISSLTMVLLILFSQYLANVTIPTYTFSMNKGWHIKRFYFFKLFPVILTIFFSWGLCGILTATNALSPDDPARTDLRLSALKETNWLRVPYPGQWGMPTFNVGPALGVIAAIIASSVESVGDYFACAKLAGAPAPPTHAVNRGIMMEGFGCIISGFAGTGGGLTSFSQNIGAIAITKVGSRRVVQFASIIIIFCSLIGKFGVLLVAVPSPVMGGVFFIMFTIITGVGLSSIQYINMNSSRNLFILGFSIFMGLSIPDYLQNNPGKIQTGSVLFNQIIEILLQTNMFIGGFFGCLLDNTIPGSNAERGLIAFRRETAADDSEQENACYNIPFGMSFIRKCNCLKYFPISPTYRNQNIKTLHCGFLDRKKKRNAIGPSDTTEMTLPGIANV